ncbi:MAG: proC [Bacteroidetes bacterium]|jgi:pyrroline-5-carboxylate reductase|nr:proC [Bacteroidota bacterium]MBS1233712.1 proC [Bacteroidota bacterium]
MDKKIAILGAGNLGTSLAKGLLVSDQCTLADMILTDKRGHRIGYLREKGYTVTDNNAEAVKQSQIVVMSIKPQQFESLAQEIRESITPGHIVLSTITGVTLKEIESAIGKVPIFRIMPNTALAICESMTCIASKNTHTDHNEIVLSMFNKMGSTLEITEDMMGAATVVGACGIAFALRFMRAMSQGGIEIGFNSEMSQLITAQTVKGAARLILETNNHPEREIDKVTTPQGITISGLNEMEHQGLSSAVIRGLITSFTKLEHLMEKSSGHKDG